MEQFKMKPLPYEFDALKPVISRQAMELHWGKHYGGYVYKLNEIIAQYPLLSDFSLEELILDAVPNSPLYNNAAQVWNHEFFFEQLTPESRGGIIRYEVPKLFDALNCSLSGGINRFKELFMESANDLFGSGWVWLVLNKVGILNIFSGQDANNFLKNGYRPLMCFDVWEHAYYLDYQNRRKLYVEDLWNIIDWKVIEKRYEKCI